MAGHCAGFWRRWPSIDRAAVRIRVYIACGVADMRKRMVGLAMLIEQGLGADPFDGAVYAFGDAALGSWSRSFDMTGSACRSTLNGWSGPFLWPSPVDEYVAISTAQLGYMLDGVDWRNPQRTWRPAAAG